MIGGSFADPNDGVRGGCHLHAGGKGYFSNLNSETLHDFHGLLQCLLAVGVKLVERRGGRDAQSHSSNASFHKPRVIGDWQRHAVGIVWIITGHDFEEDGAVLHGLRQRTHMVQSPTDRDDSVTAYQTEGGLVAHYTADG